MRYADISIKLFIFTISLFFMMQFVPMGFAVTSWRESERNGGWQIWISATDFEEIQGIGTSKTEVKLAEKATKPWLSEDILIATDLGGFADFEFESPVEGAAYMWGRIADFRGGGQSWFIVLNSLNHAGEGLIFGTPGLAWQWVGNRDVPDSKSPTDLKKGKNTARIVPREARAGVEPLFDVFTISTKPIEPTDADFNAAQKRGLAVEPADKLATTWASIKNNFHGTSVQN
ncbi:hypothetical protein F4009_03510 [Candidatus Poribacteria bacterium]|nr:hypothetical protein [Candidatus Poribacteria bacterium]MYA71395.1 hypothetical protein [Candidatus Poribacteria bacterium]MYH83432.1 hypothetical protein [Candidatus Poribacteria bacterium]MYK93065.1 hypothetical protein [Candidatus Poribacteria bacterium]